MSRGLLCTAGTVSNCVRKLHLALISLQGPVSHCLGEIDASSAQCLLPVPSHRLHLHEASVSSISDIDSIHEEGTGCKPNMPS